MEVKTDTDDARKQAREERRAVLRDALLACYESINQIRGELTALDEEAWWGTSTVSTPEYQQEQREKNQRARDLVDGLARKGAE